MFLPLCANKMESKKFLTADGTYCHILPDKIIFGELSEIEKIPEMNHSNKNVISLISAFCVVSVASGFTYLYYTEQMLVELWIAILIISFIVLFRTWLFRDTSNTLCVEKKYISSTKLIKRSMGYSMWVIFFKNEKGEKLRRFVRIYDSKEFEEKAEKVLREEGLIA